MYFHRVTHILIGELELPIKLLFYQHASVASPAERRCPTALNECSLFELYGLLGASVDPKSPCRSSFEELSA